MDTYVTALPFFPACLQCYGKYSGFLIPADTVLCTPLCNWCVPGILTAQTSSQDDTTPQMSVHPGKLNAFNTSPAEMMGSSFP